MKHTFLSIRNSTAIILMAAGVCSTADAVAQEDAYKYEGNTVTFHSRKFETTLSGKMDTLILTDPITGQDAVKVTPSLPEPISMNGRKIYEINDVATAPWNNGIALPLEKHLLNSFKDNAILKSFADGTFSLHLRDIIIDEQGRVVYYELSSFIYTGTDGQQRQLNTQGIDKWFQTAPALKPAMQNGKNVMVRLNTSISDNYMIAVKNHVINYNRR